MFGGLFILWIVDGRIKREQALHALISATLAWIAGGLVKDLFPILRPFKINGFPPLTFTIPSDASFPSIHAAVAFSLAITIWMHNKKIGVLYLVAAFLVGVSRVVGNVHFPVDILAGAILGSIIAFSVEKLHPATLITKKKRRS